MIELTKEALTLLRHMAEAHQDAARFRKQPNGEALARIRERDARLLRERARGRADV